MLQNSMHIPYYILPQLPYGTDANAKGWTGIKKTLYTTMYYSAIRAKTLQPAFPANNIYAECVWILFEFLHKAWKI